jgi:nicotinamidase-related amidase
LVGCNCGRAGARSVGHSRGEVPDVGFQDTELDSILRNLAVTTVLFAGVNADQCVLCTLQDANFRGYDCLLLEDCVATTSPDYCMSATLYNVRQCFGFVVRSEAVTSQLS